METQSPTSLKGQFLVAMPKLVDPNFFKTVTCMAEANENGAMGIVINRIHPELSAKDIFDELKIEYMPDTISVPIFLGGPVHINELFILHGPPFDWQGCHPITPFLALSNSRDILQAIAMSRGPESYMITLGCAGWAPGQLDFEIRENVWLNCNIAVEIIFDTPVASRWEMAVRNIGIDPVSLSDTAGHA